MPPKKRIEKRRLDPAAETAAWSMVFSSSYDYFADLKGVSVETDAYDRPDRAAVEEAWHRLGARFLATRDPREQREPWALQQFGEPHAR